jgi:hypothetical protein
VGPAAAEAQLRQSPRRLGPAATATACMPSWAGTARATAGPAPRPRLKPPLHHHDHHHPPPPPPRPPTTTTTTTTTPAADHLGVQRPRQRGHRAGRRPQQQAGHAGDRAAAGAAAGAAGLLGRAAPARRGVHLQGALRRMRQPSPPAAGCCLCNAGRCRTAYPQGSCGCGCLDALHRPCPCRVSACAPAAPAPRRPPSLPPGAHKHVPAQAPGARAHRLCLHHPALHLLRADPGARRGVACCPLPAARTVRCCSRLLGGCTMASCSWHARRWLVPCALCERGPRRLQRPHLRGEQLRGPALLLPPQVLTPGGFSYSDHIAVHATLVLPAKAGHRAPHPATVLALKDLRAAAEHKQQVGRGACGLRTTWRRAPGRGCCWPVT